MLVPEIQRASKEENKKRKRGRKKIKTKANEKWNVSFKFQSLNLRRYWSEKEKGWWENGGGKSPI